MAAASAHCTRWLFFVLFYMPHSSTSLHAEETFYTLRAQLHTSVEVPSALLESIPPFTATFLLSVDCVMLST
jgi:hypothetical protein